MMGAAATLLVDAHVHIYDSFDLDQLLDAALINFTRAADKMAINDDFAGIMLLTETSCDNWFTRASAAGLSAVSSSRWKIEKKPEKTVLKATNDGGKSILIIAGRQINTAEGLELLALVTDAEFAEGLPVVEALRAIRDRDAIPVLPWAVGKWMGKRGKILTELLQKESNNELFLGDNSCRPIFWYNPFHFKQACALNMSILPGTDLLPLSGEVNRVGRFGFSLRGKLSESQPAADLKRLLRTKGVSLLAYGQPENPLRCFINQIRIRIEK